MDGRHDGLVEHPPSEKGKMRMMKMMISCWAVRCGEKENERERENSEREETKCERMWNGISVHE